MAKRKVLLVDDEVTVLLTMKAVLEISGFVQMAIKGLIVLAAVLVLLVP